MPQEAFANLKPEKKQRLINAAIREFSEKPYERASVFDIAKNADISRSSFYYYFTDKEDVYNYILEEFFAEFEQQLPENRSVLDLHLMIFDFFAKFKGTEKQNLLFRVLENMKPSVQNMFQATIDPNRRSERIPLEDTEKLVLTEKNDLPFYYFVTITCTMHALKNYYDSDGSLEEIRSKLCRYMEYLHSGVLKEEFR